MKSKFFFRMLLIVILTISFASDVLAQGKGRGGGGGGGANAEYTIVPFLPGGMTTLSSHVTDLNEMGNAVGIAEIPGGGYAALHYDLASGVYTSLAGNSPTAFGTNDRNQIVGTTVVAGVDKAAFWSNRMAVPTLLNGLPGETRSEALDINDDGIVVGTSGLGHFQSIGVAWRVVVDEVGVVNVKGPYQLPPLPSQSFTGVWRVNELLDGKAQVAGISHTQLGSQLPEVGFQSREAVLWTLTLNTDGTLSTTAAPERLGKLARYQPSYSSAGGLNDLGDVCGDSDLRPFVAWDGQLAKSLPVPKDTQFSWANDINNLGHIVGELDIFKLTGYINGPGNYHPYLWKNGQMIDLKTKVNLGSWNRLWGASQINDAGIIAGYGRYDVERRGFLLIPK